MRTRHHTTDLSTEERDALYTRGVLRLDDRRAVSGFTWIRLGPDREALCRVVTERHDGVTTLYLEGVYSSPDFTKITPRDR